MITAFNKCDIQNVFQISYAIGALNFTSHNLVRSTSQPKGNAMLRNSFQRGMHAVTGRQSSELQCAAPGNAEIDRPVTCAARSFTDERL
jgi:hypothetical protein